MKKIIAMVLMAMPLIASCGGGGGSDGGSAPTRAVLTLSAEGTLPAGAAVSGFGVTIELPAGVTVKTAADGITVDDPTVVVPSGLLGGIGSATVVQWPIFTAATVTSKAKLNFVISSNALAGVGVGEYATITFILSGVTPAAADFNVVNFNPFDLDGALLTGLTASTTLTVQ